MERPVVTVAVEGDPDQVIVRRILDLVGLDMGPVHGLRGKDWLDQQLGGYNYAAQQTPWLVLRDLDQDAECAPPLIGGLLPKPSAQMCFRITVRAAEAWLLADADQISQFLRISKARISREPESLLDPKREMIELARRSRHRAVREDMVPATGSSARVGPAYTARIIEFASIHWRVEVAAQRSVSLARCIAALRKFLVL